MSSRCAVLVVGALEAGLWRAGALTRYAADEAGRARLAQDATGLEVRVLLDVVDEEFRREPLPGLRAGQARALLAQRAARLFPIEARLACEPLETTEGQLCAIPQPAVLDAWLTVLRAAQARLAGIHSVPMLGPALARHLEAGPAPLVLVFATRHGGLRQLLVDARGVRVARLSPLGGAGDAEAIRHETSRFLRYLEETNALGSVSVHCLLPHAMHGDLAPHRCHAHEGYFADALLSELAQQQPPSLDYANGSERASFLQHRRQKRAWRAAQGVAATAAIVATLGLAGTAQLRKEAARLGGAASLLQEQDVAPSTPLKAALSAAAIAEIEHLARPSRAMRDALAALGGVLAMHNAVLPEAIAWHASNTLTFAFRLAASPHQQPRALVALLDAFRAVPGVHHVAEDSATGSDGDNAPLDAASLSAGQASVHTVTLTFLAAAGHG